MASGARSGASNSIGTPPSEEIAAAAHWASGARAQSALTTASAAVPTRRRGQAEPAAPHRQAQNAGRRDERQDDRGDHLRRRAIGQQRGQALPRRAQAERARAHRQQCPEAGDPRPAQHARPSGMPFAAAGEALPLVGGIVAGHGQQQDRGEVHTSTAASAAGRLPTPQSEQRRPADRTHRPAAGSRPGRSARRSHRPARRSKPGRLARQRSFAPPAEQRQRPRPGRPSAAARLPRWWRFGQPTRTVSSLRARAQGRAQQREQREAGERRGDDFDPRIARRRREHQQGRRRPRRSTAGPANAGSRATRPATTGRRRSPASSARRPSRWRSATLQPRPAPASASNAPPSDAQAPRTSTRPQGA